MNFIAFDTLIEGMGTFLGFVYVYFQYKASPKLWWMCWISAVPLLYVNFSKGYLATGLLYLYYFLTAIYKIAISSPKSMSQSTLQIERLPLRHYPIVALGTIFIFAFFFSATQTNFFGVLEALGQPTEASEISINIADAGGTTLCFLGMWLLSRNFLEQWYAWLVADVFFAYLYICGNNYMLVCLMAFYIIISIVGLYNWQSLYKQQSLK